MADWTWAPHLDNDTTTKGTMLSIALGVSATGCVVAAVFVDNVRYLLVMGFMLASVAYFGRSATGQLRSLTVGVDAGVATIADKRSTTTIDLRQVDSIDVSSRGDFVGSRRWAIEAVGPQGAIEHRIRNIEQYWTLPEDQIDRLREGLQHYHSWYRANAAPPVAQPDPLAHQQVAGPQTAAAAAVSGAPFEWQIPRHPNADRNRRWVALGSAGLAAVLAIAGIVSAWPDPVGILLSIVVLPGIIGLLGGGLWWSYGRVERFRLTVTDGVLSANGAVGSNKPVAVPLRGATNVVVDTSTSYVASGTGSTTRQTITYIHVEQAKGQGPARITIPSGPGSVMNAEHRILLEAQLRQLAGLA